MAETFMSKRNTESSTSKPLKSSKGAYVPPSLRKKQAEAQASSNTKSSSRNVVNSDRFKNLDLSTPPSHGYGFQESRSGFKGAQSGFRKDRGGGGGRRTATQPDPRVERELFGDPEEESSFTGINFDKYDDIPVEVNGSNPPEPATAFDTLNLHERVSLNVALCRYTRPTPIQKYSIPTACSMRDLMACAQTGSGKTAAFLLPVINNMLLKGTDSSGSQESGLGGSSRRFQKKHSPCALILAPTRELATQIFEESQKFLYCTGMRSVVVYGGQDIRNQLRELEKGCELLVATPGRLMDFIERGRISMSNIRHLIFDEADRMLDMGFEPQIRAIVEECDMPASIGSYEDVDQGRQTLMFSATFPREIQKLASDFLNDYIFVTVGRLGSTNEFIIQTLEYCEDYDKRSALMRLLPECEGLTVIFVETKRGADALEMFLNDQGINAISIHGDRSQREREYALSQFKSGNNPVLVATDVAARGLDIDNVLHVVNYDLPSSIDDYVHRIGRTGRRGNTGNAHSFVSDKNRAVAKELYELLKESNQEVPGWFEEMCAYNSRGGGGGGGRRGGRRGGGGGGGSRFGAKDYRKGGDPGTTGGGSNWRSNKSSSSTAAPAPAKKQFSSASSSSNKNTNSASTGGSSGGPSWSNLNQRGFSSNTGDAW